MEQPPPHVPHDFIPPPNPHLLNPPKQPDRPPQLGAAYDVWQTGAGAGAAHGVPHDGIEPPHLDRKQPNPLKQPRDEPHEVVVPHPPVAHGVGAA